MAELPQLVEELNNDHRLGAELLEKLPEFFTKNKDIEFKEVEPGTTITVPSFPKIDAQIADSDVGKIRRKTQATANATNGLVVQYHTIAREIKQSFNLIGANLIDFVADANKDHFYNAEESPESVRFDFAAEDTINLDRRYNTDGTKIQDILLPKHEQRIVSKLGNNTEGAVVSDVVVGNVGYNLNQVNNYQTASIGNTAISSVPASSSGFISSIFLKVNTDFSARIFTLKVFARGTSTYFTMLQSMVVTLPAGTGLIEGILATPIAIQAGEYLGFSMSNIHGLGMGGFSDPATFWTYDPSATTGNYSQHSSAGLGYALYADILAAGSGSGSSIEGTVNVNAYPSITKSITTRTVPYWQYRYGSYWWQDNQVIQTKTTQVDESLNGSFIAQTFKDDGVLLGIKVYIDAPGLLKVNANSLILICETELGLPRPDKMMVKATLKEDVNASKEDNVAIAVTYECEHPVLIKPGKSYCWLMKADAEWNVYYGANQDKNGSLFYTQDGVYFMQDIGKDISYDLVFTDFGTDTNEKIIELKSVSLSGGVGSLTYDVVAEFPQNTGLDIEVKLNDAWIPIAHLDKLNTQPPYFGVRAKLKGDQYHYPLLNTKESKLQVFRPYTDLKYLTQPKLVEKDSLTVSYTLTGFNSEIHTFTPRLRVDGNQTLNPLNTIEPAMNEGTATFVATFDLTNITQYEHDVIGHTGNTKYVYQVKNIIEI